YTTGSLPLRNLCKTLLFAQFLRQAQFLILKIRNVFLWLKISPSLNLNKNEHFPKVSLPNYQALQSLSFSKCRCTMQFLHLDARTSEKPYQCDIKLLILQRNLREIVSSHGLKHGVEVDSHLLNDK
ncbi:MAG: hypothetical protein WB792_01965, partial [Desulfobacterales bacterium]